MKPITNYLRKTKIIATFGPAIRDPKIFRSTISAGVNVIRFNFSHLTPEQAKVQVNWARNQLRDIGYKVGFLADLKGPEIRSDLDTYELKKGEEFYLCHTKIKAKFKQHHSKTIVGIDHPKLYALVTKGQRILADDGYFEFKVLGVEKQAIRLHCMNTGTLKTKKSIIVPEVDIKLPILNKTDRTNLKVAAQEGFAWIAASFVSSAKDVQEIRSYIKKCGKDIPIISKIENRKGVINISEIVQESDGIMVARGDLGLEYDYEQVPILQEQIVNEAKKYGKVAIIATQMLNSMIENSRPSRPEVSDISHAIRSKVDAVMLSGETASGEYPVQAVHAMARIASTSEQYYFNHDIFKYEDDYRLATFCEMAIQLALALGSKAIIGISSKGKTARYLSAFRANLPKIIATQNQALFYRCFLYYGVIPVMMKTTGTKRELFLDIIKQCKDKKYFRKGDEFIHLFTHAPDRISKQHLLATNSIREEVVE